MSRPVDEGAALELVPPRPNPGPEPWDDARSPLPVIGLILLAILAALTLRWWWRRRRRARSGGQIPDPVESESLPPTSRARLIAASEAIRSAMAENHGSAWRSRTTEELADDPGLLALLGAEQAANLVALYRLSDRAKFADEDPSDADGWPDRADRLLAELSRKRGEPGGRR